MPTYDYKCPECEAVGEITHSIKVDPEFACPECEKKGKTVKLIRQISLNTNGFVFKQWTETMAWKAKRDKNKQNKDLAVKQVERYGTGMGLQPNVAGMEVDSWSDAKKLAKEAGMNTESYNSHIQNEKHVSKSSGIDDRKWKAVKEIKNK